MLVERFKDEIVVSDIVGNTDELQQMLLRAFQQADSGGEGVLTQRQVREILKELSYQALGLTTLQVGKGGRGRGGWGGRWRPGRWCRSECLQAGWGGMGGGVRTHKEGRAVWTGRQPRDHVSGCCLGPVLPSGLPAGISKHVLKRAPTPAPDPVTTCLSAVPSDGVPD